MSLSPEQRQMLRVRLLNTLPAEPDGSIPLRARAFAIREWSRKMTCQHHEVNVGRT